MKRFAFARFFFAGKVALIFVLLLGLSLGGTFVLFLRVAAPELMHEVGRLRAQEVVPILEQLEAALETEQPGASLDSPEIRDLLRREGSRLDVAFYLGRDVEPPPEPPRRRWLRERIHPQTFTVEGHEVYQLGPPSFDLWLPLERGAERVGHLRVRGPSHAARVHMAFERGLVRIGVLALLSVVILTLVLTAPLRRMSRSMDRVAAGELDHRLEVRGRDEVARMARSFNAMADRVEEMVTGQKGLLAGVSHELRSPLARMKLTLELLRTRGEVPEARLAALEEEVDHVDVLVGELLASSRLELGTAPLRRERVELEPAIRAAWEKAKPLRSAAGAGEDPELTLSIAADAHQTQADPDLVARILGNVFGNAVRYAEGEVRVRVERKEERITIEVADDGPGAPEEDLDKLFEPFYRADPSRSHGHHVGLGLALVRRAVQAHGGTTRARRSDLGGLAVVFDLPGP